MGNSFNNMHYWTSDEQNSSLAMKDLDWLEV